MDFRHEFKRDVVIDMYCYRRRGHNEGDEPAFTQPVLYRAIEQRKTVRDGYLDQLLELGEITREEADRIAARADAAARRGTVRGPQRRVRRAAAGPSGRLEGLRRRPRRRRRRKSTPASTRAAGASCSKRRRDCRPIFIRIRRSSACSKRAARWPGASGRSIGRPAKRWRLASLADEGYRVRLERPGQRARHVQPAPCRAARLSRRPPLHAAAAPVARAGAGRDHQQPAVRSRRAGLRVRLQPRLPRRPGAVGSAVRRLRATRPR